MFDVLILIFKLCPWQLIDMLILPLLSGPWLADVNAQEVKMTRQVSRVPASLRATPIASLQTISRNHTLLTLWTLTLGNTDFITLGNTENIVLIISLLDSAI